MKTRAWKLLALVLALALVLTGCNLIEVDPEKDNAEVVASVNDEKITDISKSFGADELKKGIIVRRGKKNYSKVILA